MSHVKCLADYFILLEEHKKKNLFSGHSFLFQLGRLSVRYLCSIQFISFVCLKSNFLIKSSTLQWDFDYQRFYSGTDWSFFHSKKKITRTKVTES